MMRGENSGTYIYDTLVKEIKSVEAATDGNGGLHKSKCCSTGPPGTILHPKYWLNWSNFESNEIHSCTSKNSQKLYCGIRNIDLQHSFAQSMAEMEN